MTTLIELDPEDKQKRIDRIMEHTKEEIATQWVTLGSDIKEKYDKLIELHPTCKTRSLK
jgi:hypothetical protein